MENQKVTADNVSVNTSAENETKDGHHPETRQQAAACANSAYEDAERIGKNNLGFKGFLARLINVNQVKASAALFDPKINPTNASTCDTNAVVIDNNLVPSITAIAKPLEGGEEAMPFIPAYYKLALLRGIYRYWTPDYFVFYRTDDGAGTKDIFFSVHKGEETLGYYDLSTDKPVSVC